MLPMRNGNNNDEHFPRELTIQERVLLNSILPENKPGYKNYRDKINRLMVIGHGRFGAANLILGNADQQPDIDSPSAPVFASGTFTCLEGEIDIAIHEERYEQIEIDISPGGNLNTGNQSIIPGNLVKINSWSYSDWVPGEKAPLDNSEIREISLIPDKYLLAIAPAHKKIWLYEYEAGVNHLIPVTNLYNYLMIVKNIRDIKIVGNQNLFFKDLNACSDNEIISAFILYNNYFKKFNLNLSGKNGEKKSGNSNLKYPAENKILHRNKFFQKFYKRGKN